MKWVKKGFWSLTKSFFFFWVVTWTLPPGVGAPVRDVLPVLPVLPGRAQTGRTNPRQTTQRRSFILLQKGSKYIYTTFKEAREQRAGREGWIPPPPGCHLLRCVRPSRTHSTNKGYHRNIAKHSFYLPAQISRLTSDQDQFPSSGSNQQMWFNWSRICWKRLQVHPLHGFISNNMPLSSVATSPSRHPPV